MIIADIQYQGHKSDIVHTLVGFNKSTGGDFKVGQAKDVVTGDTTVYNCYEHGNLDCYREEFWGKDGNTANIPTWQPAYPVPQKQTQIIQQIQEIKEIEVEAE